MIEVLHSRQNRPLVQDDELLCADLTVRRGIWLRDGVGMALGSPWDDLGIKLGMTLG